MHTGVHGRLLQDLSSVGWSVERAVRVSGQGSPNPTRVVLRRGRRRRHLLVYAWRVTTEGKGRERPGQPLRGRVQTTRAHDGDLLFQPGHVTVGVGWEEQRGVWFAFDAWAKRHTGKSSSVYVEPSFLRQAERLGAAAEERSDCLELAFRPERVGALLPWLDALSRPRLVPLSGAVSILEHSPEHLVVEGSARRHERLTWLREGDHTVLRDVDDRTVWRVTGAYGRQDPASTTNHPLVTVELRPYGRVVDREWLQ